MDTVDVVVISVVCAAALAGVIVMCWWFGPRPSYEDHYRLLDSSRPNGVPAYHYGTQRTAYQETLLDPTTVTPKTPTRDATFALAFEEEMARISLAQAQGGDSDEEDWTITTVFTGRSIFCRNCGQSKSTKELRFCTACGQSDP
eukprot:m.30052 g.30052  ORF g.30052 m.30052 type:complete len:144 (+) comp4660_c0_seq2:554-985(+)